MRVRRGNLEILPKRPPPSFFRSPEDQGPERYPDARQQFCDRSTGVDCGFRSVNRELHVELLGQRSDLTSRECSTICNPGTDAKTTNSCSTTQTECRVAARALLRTRGQHFSIINNCVDKLICLNVPHLPLHQRQRQTRTSCSQYCQVQVPETKTLTLQPNNTQNT